MVTGVYCLYSINGRVENVLIYKRGHYYGPLKNQKYTSVEQCIAILSRTGFTIEGISVTLTNQLFPDK